MNDGRGRPFEPFDLSILAAPDARLWLSAHSEQGSVYGVPRNAPSWKFGAGPQAPVEWLTEAVAQARPDAPDDARRVGRILMELAFDVPEVATLLHQTRGVAASRGAQLLVRVLAAPQELSALPWELLLDPQQPDRFLTMARDCHVVRAARSRTYPVKRAVIEPPLNMLLVLSSPLREGPSDTEAPFDLYEEKRSLLAELQPLVERGLLNVEVEDRPSIDRLRTRIAGRGRGFHLLHYLGHAQPAGLKLEQPNGRGRLVPSAEFSLLLQQMPDLRLAVFAGCETALAPKAIEGEVAWPGMLSTADHFVRDACPMVIGMQAVLPFGTERLLTRYFYQALTGGQSVAEALRQARLAIADDDVETLRQARASTGDDTAGPGLLNWAVPTLFVGGSEPVALIDLNTRAKSLPPVRRIGLRLGVRQGELRFISRLTEMREAIDALSATRSATPSQRNVRVVMIVGLPGTGKTSFLDRVVEELDPGVAYLLVSVGRLLEEEDPLLFLAQRVAEIVNQTGRQAPAQGRDNSAVWWERLLEVLAETPLALALDDANRLRGDGAGEVRLREALIDLTKRRGRTRLALAADDDLAQVTGGLAAGQVRTIRLQALSWPEVWQWIRRNLPVLTRFGDALLAPFYADLPRLEDWERLAERIAGERRFDSRKLSAVVRQISGSAASATTTTLAPSTGSDSATPIFGASKAATGPATGPASTQGPAPAAGAAAETAPRAVRVAVAGPFMRRKSDEFARAITQFAAEHGVAGRVAGPTSADTVSRLAELVPLASPFGPKGDASDAKLVSWLDQAVLDEADIILLDFGSEVDSPTWNAGLGAVAARNRLIVAAGGNDKKPVFPAWSPHVLAVGALQLDGAEAPYSVYFPEVDKPELFAPNSVAGTALAAVITDPTIVGTSTSALHVVAAAIVVWATDRGLSARDVRTILVETAAPLSGGKPPRAVDVDAALMRTRRQLLVDALEKGPLHLAELLATTGMRPEHALPILDAAAADGSLRRTTQDGQDRYENPDAVYLAYTRLRETPFSATRTVELTRLVERVQTLARRGRYRSDEVRALWDSGLEARRVSALAILQAEPRLGSASILVEAIDSPRSPFELYQALVAVTIMLDSLDPATKAEVGAAIERALSSSDMLGPTTEQAAMARAILARVEGRPAKPAPDTASVPAVSRRGSTKMANPRRF